MLKSYKTLATLLVLLTVFGLDAQTFPVNWSSLRNVEVVNGILQRESNAEKKGVATSQQLLFGRGQTNTFAGYFEFSVTSTSELKKIGFVALDDPTEQVGGITYGFTFLANGKVKATGINGGTAKLSYTAGDVFRIERVGGRVLRYFINGAEVYVEPGDVFQSYQIRAVLKSNNASFSNVVCSYQTTPFCVVPEIDNVNKTIRLAISGAYPPYTYTWDHGPVLVRGTHQDPTNEPIYQVLTDGNYWVTIKDATGNEFRKRYSVGADINWSSLYQTSSSGDLLTYTGSSKWGSAVHFSSFNQNSNGWVEYIIDHNEGKRAFGFVESSQIVRKTRHIKAGFLVNNAAIQVIYNGNVVFTGDYENKDVLTLHYFQGTVVWMKNGVEFYSSQYTGTGDFTIAGMLRGNAIEKHLNYSFNPDSYITKTWTEANDQGSIEVNITSLNISGPYHYIVSKEHIPELFELYTFITDSIGVEIDSVQFFTGSEVNTSFTFDNLEAGTYNVAVFDSHGNRIFGQEVDLYGELGIEAGNGLLVAGNTVQSSQENGAGSLELYLTQGENLGMEIEVGRNGGNIQQFIGLADEQTTVNGFQDLEYGFYLDGKKLYTVESGVLSSSFEIIRQNKTLEISIQDGELILKANMEDLVTVQLPALYTYKLGVGMDPGAILKLNYSGKPPKKSKYRFNSSVLQYLNCEETNPGQFSFSINLLANLNGSQIQYSVLNSTTNEIAVPTSIASDNFLIQVNSLFSGAPLSAGIYTVQFIVGGQTYTESICFGYEVDWTQIDQDYIESPNTYSALVSGHDELTFLQARSNNIMRHDDEGWIEFTSVTNASSAFNYFRPTTNNLNDAPQLGQTATGEDLLLFYRGLNSNQIYMLPFSETQGNVGFEQIPLNARVKLVYTVSGGTSGNGQIEVFVNGTSVEIMDRGNSSVIARCNSIMNTDGFRNIITSFPCAIPSDIYAHLKYKMDGFYHTMKKGEIKFVFDQEYDDAPLKFNIYDQEDNLVKTQADFPPLLTTYGDNYLLLDVSENGECIGRGFFYVEVINSKKEKSYLRLFNDYTTSGCTDYITN
ncbi:MAG: hypothetical protein HRT58_22000 [Crocinitomicaceae bacterium]|nr:hypothetical protein [Flavobacteriales bacterium]NQZ38349.1 hypothetical protein [Crocinitomicaceae bacterium]